MFTRCAEKGVTTIYADGKHKTAVCYAYDCNSLYLSTFDKLFPGYQYVCRQYENQFKPQVNTMYVKAQVWLHNVSETGNIHIRSEHNMGKEVSVGKYKVDGIYSDENRSVTILEYNGCWFHSHHPTLCKQKLKTVRCADTTQRDAERDQYLNDR